MRRLWCWPASTKACSKYYSSLITHLSTTKMEESSWIGFHAKGFHAKGTQSLSLELFTQLMTWKSCANGNWNRKSFPSSLPRLNQSERTDSLSRAHDEFCQSNALEQAFKTAIIIRDCKCLPKTWCWKMSRTCCTSDGNSVWAKLANCCALNFQGALCCFSTFMGVHCENSKLI